MSSESIKHRLWLGNQKGRLIKKWSMLKELKSRCGWSTPTNRGRSQNRGRNWNCRRQTSRSPPTQIKKIEAEMRVLRGNGHLYHWHRERRKAVQGCVQWFINIYINISTSKSWELQEIICKSSRFSRWQLIMVSAYSWEVFTEFKKQVQLWDGRGDKLSSLIITNYT